MTCQLFDDNRKRLLALIYELKEFTLEDLKEKFQYEGLIGDDLTIKDFIFPLCEIGSLSYDGHTFRVVFEQSKKYRKYFVVFKDHDPIVIEVKEDVNRPNNPDCEQVLIAWVEDNYGPFAEYAYYELSSYESHTI